MADIIKTHGDNKKILKITKFKKFSSIENSIKKTIMWYKDYFLKKKLLIKKIKKYKFKCV